MTSPKARGASPRPSSGAALSRVLDSRLDAIGPFAAEFEHWARGCGVPQGAAAQASLMLDELITNTIVHGYGLRAGHAVRVDALHDAQGLHLVLTDHAPAFNPLLLPGPGLDTGMEERSVGGLGVHFVRRLADAIEYARVSDGGQPANRLRILKRTAG